MESPTSIASRTVPHPNGARSAKHDDYIRVRGEAVQQAGRSRSLGKKHTQGKVFRIPSDGRAPEEASEVTAPFVGESVTPAAPGQR